MRKLEILFVMHTSLHTVFGASKSARNHIEALRPKFNIHVHDQFSSKNLAGGTLVLRNAKSFTFTNRENILTLFKLVLGVISLPYLILRAKQCDIIHLNSITLLPYSLVLKSIFPQKKVICHVREILAYQIKFSSFLSNFIDEFVFIDREVQTIFLKNLNMRKPGKVITNFTINSPHKKKLFNFNKNCVHIGIVGLFSREKRFLELMDYINAGSWSSDFPVIFHVAGGPGGDIKYAKKCLAGIMACSLIEFHGIVPEIEKTNFYQEIDGLIRFDAHKSVGRTVAEAIEWGCQIYTFRDISNEIDVFRSYKSYFKSIECHEEFKFTKKERALNTHINDMIKQNYIKMFVRHIYTEE